MSIEQILHQFKLSNSNRLVLKENITEFPTAIFELADTLEILDLSGNQLSSLPDDLPRLHKLRILFCSNNQFTELPEVLGQCSNLSMVGFKSNQIEHVPAASLGKSLRWLILTDNRIAELPETIGNCPDLQKLMLAGNRLTSLPETLANCSKLELIRIAANRLDKLPDYLFNLPRLSWLAMAGNPVCSTSEIRASSSITINAINWNTLQILEKLGEGASGEIYRAQYMDNDVTFKDVAIKLFKGNMTSDGLPLSEKTACIAAGIHPNLIPVLGKITNHPEGSTGLVMSLVHPEFRTLAFPPSLESCTRDVYDMNQRFTLKTVLKIAHDIASVAHHLHDRSILHGDLYAHNIQHDGNGNCLLGDFGAASFYPHNENESTLAMQQIEVRAFGCLLEELLDRCIDSGIALQQLRNLQIRCLDSRRSLRPAFSVIVNEIAAIMRDLEN